MTPADVLADRLVALADGVTRIRAHQRHRPEVFTEDKSDVARMMRELATDIRTFGRMPVRAEQRFVPSSVVDHRGREIRVERRSRG